MDLKTGTNDEREYLLAFIDRAVQALWVVFGSVLAASSVYISTISAYQHPDAYQFVISQFAAGFAYLCTVFLIVKRPVSVSTNYILLVGIACRLILLPSQPLFDSSMYSLSGIVGLQPIILLKSAIFVFDIANMLLIIAILQKLRLPKSWVVVYAWCPLAIKEFANSGHMEPVMIFFLLVALCCLISRRRTRGWAGLALGAAAAANFAAAIIAPVAWKLERWKALAGMAVIAALYAILQRPAWAAFSMPNVIYPFNDGGFALLRQVESFLFPATSGSVLSPARIAAALIIASYSIYTASRLNRLDRMGTAVAIRNILAACILVMPSARPWYACWMLPFLCFAPNVGMLLLIVTCNLSYVYYAEGYLPSWVQIIEYIPVFTVLLGEYMTRKTSPQPAKIFVLNCEEERE